jgi:carbamoyl-phosphate synthase small subunit
MSPERGILRAGVRPAVLVLADGTVFRGSAFGATGVKVGEVCFNTSMTGYQEILTDPSYAGQIVVMTYTEIGNVGVNGEDEESGKPWLAGFVVRDYSPEPSNWRARQSLGQYLKGHGVPGITSIDTRALVRRIRDRGFQNGALSTDPERQDVAELLAAAREAPPMDGSDWASQVCCDEPYEWSEGTWEGVDGYLPRHSADGERRRLVAIDFGIKRNILRLLVDHGFDVTVVPSDTSAEAVRALGPDAVFLSNGPGDPAAVQGAPETVRELAQDYPIFGICLGHQILGLALGGETRKLKFGHHGANQPGKDVNSGRVAICAENHGYSVDADSLREAGEHVEITHLNLNDGTVEGLAHAERPIFSVQYHPEASPGPHDARYFFARFREMVDRHKSGEPVTGLAVAEEGPGGD